MGQSWRRYDTALTKILAVIQFLSSTTGRLIFVQKFNFNKTLLLDCIWIFAPTLDGQNSSFQKIWLKKFTAIFENLLVLIFWQKWRLGIVRVSRYSLLSPVKLENSRFTNAAMSNSRVFLYFFSSKDKKLQSIVA